MGVSAKLVDGVIQLTKLMAHGAMHEACLIEVIRTVEDEAFILVKKVKKCVERGGVIVADDDSTPPSIDDEMMMRYIPNNNATVLDLDIKLRAAEDASLLATRAVKNDMVSDIPLNAVPAKVGTGLTKEEVKQGIVLLQKKENTGVQQEINAEIRPDVVPGVEAPKENIKEEVREEMKKLLRRMMGDNSKGDNLKLKLLKELEKNHNNNVDGKL